jgi:D-alanyl-D-alanine carboxypeptidase (penicillin-binding protein 5/6)
MVFGIGPENINAKSAILMDYETGNILYEYNADEQLAPASLTKIMTLILTMENIENGNIKEDETLVCSEHANSMQGSQIWLDPGEEMSLDDILKSVIIASANDATVVLAERIAGSENNFVNMMNQKAKDMGLTLTNFQNCTGLDQDNHVTTAREIAIMSRELLKHKKIRNYTTVWMDSLRNGKTELVNTNRLIRFYPGATGLKTGTTDKAGCCLSASAERDGLSLISVVMGAPTTDDRFETSKYLLNYGFDNYVLTELEDIQKDLPNIKVNMGTEDYVGLTAQSPNKILVKRGKSDKITQKIKLPKSLSAPLKKDQIVGTVEVYDGDHKLNEYPVKISMSVPKIDFKSALKKMLTHIITI